MRKTTMVTEKLDRGDRWERTCFRVFFINIIISVIRFNFLCIQFIIDIVVLHNKYSKVKTITIKPRAQKQEIIH